MTDASQPEKAKGKILPAGILATALFALLAFAPFASAATDPVSSGSTTITLNGGFTKYLGTFGIKVQKIKPATLKGSKATFKVTGGKIDPTTGAGELTHSGGLKITAGKKSVSIKALVVDTSKKTLSGKVGGKKATIAKLAGISVARNGFGVNVSAKKVKLTPAAANVLNQKLGFAGGKPLPFQKNKLIGSAKAEAQPSTLGLTPGANLAFQGNPETLGKLAKAAVKIETIAPTTGGPLAYNQPITGGTISPTATAGLIESGGGLRLVQKLEPEGPGGKKLDTTITLGGFFVDLAAKTVTVEVVATSTASPELNLGNLGRSSIADLTVTGTANDTATRTVTVSTSAALQEISAKVLNGFVSVYKAAEPSPLIPDTNPTPLATGENLGTFGFTTTTE
jgi:hypothetical protein